MSKKELKTKVEGKEEELFSKEEKIKLIKDVFEYCKKHYGLKNYSIFIMDYKYCSSYRNYNMAKIVERINPIENFKISLDITNIKTFYNVNKLVELLNLSEKDKLRVRLIITCLHEIGHSLFSLNTIQMNDTERKNYNMYNNALYHNKIFTKIGKITLDECDLIYKYNHEEILADCFMYSVIPSLLKEFNIKTEYFIIPKSKGKTTLNTKKLRTFIKQYYNLSFCKFVGDKKVNLDDDSNFNKLTKQYLDNILISDNDYYTACCILNILIIYGYEILFKYCDLDHGEKLLEFMNYSLDIDTMISPKYKKHIEKNWIDMGSLNIAFIEFPRVWRELQEEGLI